MMHEANELLSIPLAPSSAPEQAPGCCTGTPRLRLSAEEAAQLADMLKAVAHPVRLQIVDVLSRHAGEVCVCDIESQFDLKQPTISHHLKILRRAGIIDCQRQGQWLYYYIRPESMATLRELLTAWTEPLDTP
jgi:ArsR family transcriptional regulator